MNRKQLKKLLFILQPESYSLEAGVNYEKTHKDFLLSRGLTARIHDCRVYGR